MKSLFLLTLATAVALGVLRSVEFYWLIAAIFIAPVLATCLATSSRNFGGPPPGWRMLTAVSGPSVWLLWLGLHPGLYYMADFVLVILLWYGVGLMYLLRSVYFDWLPGIHQITPARTVWLRNQMCILIPLTVTLLVACRIPLRVGFLTAWPRLTAVVEDVAPHAELALKADQRCGLYTISAAASRKQVPERLVFRLADHSESGFIYSPNGIEGFRYNSGNKGHLFGNWYWMAED